LYRKEQGNKEFLITTEDKFKTVLDKRIQQTVMTEAINRFIQDFQDKLR
jgi:hypothetical protein